MIAPAGTPVNYSPPFYFYKMFCVMIFFLKDIKTKNNLKGVFFYGSFESKGFFSVDKGSTNQRIKSNYF